MTSADPRYGVKPSRAYPGPIVVCSDVNAGPQQYLGMRYTQPSKSSSADTPPTFKPFTPRYLLYLAFSCGSTFTNILCFTEENEVYRQSYSNDLASRRRSHPYGILHTFITQIRQRALEFSQYLAFVAGIEQAWLTISLACICQVKLPPALLEKHQEQPKLRGSFISGRKLESALHRLVDRDFRQDQFGAVITQSHRERNKYGHSSCFDSSCAPSCEAQP